MKKIMSILLAIMLILGVCGSAMLTIGAEEATSDTWDGTASVKWYLDGTNADGAYELNTAEDLAGLAFLVGAAQPEGRYTGVYYGADGTVAGYKAGTNDTAYQDSSLIPPESVEELECVDGDSFLGKTVVLTVDIVLNEGNAEDWATTAPANMWQPIGGNIPNEDNKVAAFDGIFDGQGHTVSGLYYKSAVEFGGLFGETGQKFPATIQNLKLTNFYVNGREECGALVGRSNHGLNVNNVYVGDGIVEGTDASASTSAVIGAVFGGTVVFKRCAVENVEVLGTLYVGIFTGMTVYQTLEINDCYVKNSSAKGEAQVALVCGRMAGGTISIRNVYAIVAIEATGTATEPNSRVAGVGLVYGVAGNNAKPSVRTVEGFYHVSTVKAADEALINAEIADQATAVELTQIKGDAAKTTMSTFDYETVWKTVEDDTPVIELRAGAEPQSPDEGDFLSDPDNGDEGDDKPDNTDSVTTDRTNTDSTTETDSSTTSKGKRGCKSVVGIAGLAPMAMTVLLGAAVVLKKKKTN